MQSATQKTEEAKILIVPFARLLANPEKYRGKRVQTIGYLDYGFEGQGIYAHVDDAKYGLFLNGLWIDSISDKKIDPSKVNRTYCVIVGVFDDRKHGHLDLWSGAFTKVERLDLWIDPKKASIEAQP